MEKKLKVVFFSCIPTPHWLKFVPHLRKYVDAEFYYYEPGNHGRPDWWLMDLGEHSHVMNVKPWKSKYFSFKPLRVLRKENPDIVVLQGFTYPASFLAYCWARFNHRKTIVFSERLRDYSRNQGGEKVGCVPRKLNFVWRIIRFLYRNVDLVGSTSKDAVSQFADEFRFGSKVVHFPYPSDIDDYYYHPVRQPKECYTLLFPNSLIWRYDPIMAIEIFKEVLSRHPNMRLMMCAYGPLIEDVKKLIFKYKIEDKVEFLDYFKCWEDMGRLYSQCDIMYLPARWSNGNYSITECRASGMACVISDKVLGTNGPSMIENESGSVVPHEVGAFVDQICWYIEHPDEFARIAPINRKVLMPVTHAEKAKRYYSIFQSL